jgi:hypothetical protein
MLEYKQMGVGVVGGTFCIGLCNLLLLDKKENEEKENDEETGVIDNSAVVADVSSSNVLEKHTLTGFLLWRQYWRHFWGSYFMGAYLPQKSVL